MAKLFIFGIGGTGSRVIKALTMLLATGIDLPNTSEIVPIIIDPDAQNGDMTRTIGLLNDYMRIEASVEHSQNRFFKTKISTLKNLLNKADIQSTLSETFLYNINNTQADTFRDFLDYNRLGDDDKAMMDLLYADKNLNLPLDQGFKGNPNIGAVVLNQFKYSQEFEKFASLFTQGDRIFIISSIFGGTGAAGFPLLLKNIRNMDSKLANHALIKDAAIGAATILPYFGVDTRRDGDIDSDTFISKTKAALSYYKRTINDTNSLNAMYYVGDSISQAYNYAEGKSEQKNRAHIVEMVAALGIVNFANQSDTALQCNNGTAVHSKVYEFGLKNDANPVRFSDLPDEISRLLFQPMTQFGYFTLYLKQQFEQSLNKQPWSSAGKNKLDGNFASKEFFRDVKSFTQAYWTWLDEMSKNERGFAPFEMTTTEASLYKFVIGKEQKAGLFGFNRSWDYATFDDKLNTAEGKIGDISPEQKFMAVFYWATCKIYEDKF